MTTTLQRFCVVTYLLVACSASSSDAADESTGASEGSTTSSGMTTAGTTPGTTEPTTTGPVTGTDTEPTSAGTMTTGGDCQASGDCTDPQNPICKEESCLPCVVGATGDADCAAKDATTPVCSDTGECVQCRPGNASACGDATPWCDGGTSTCVGCTYHEQCEGTACDIATGACFSGDCINHVDGDNAEQIGPAIEDGCIVIVHEFGVDGNTPYSENITIAGQKVAILAAEGESPRISGTSTAASLSLSAGAEVYLARLRLNQSTGLGLEVDGASVWVDRAEIVNNDGGGIELTGGASGHIRSSFVGGAVPNVTALLVSGSSLDLLYSTVVGADSDAGDGAALLCESPGDVFVRNSLIALDGAVAEIQCGAANVTTSATEAGLVGTVALGTLTSGWFVNLGNDLHLKTPPAELATAARWRTRDTSATPPRNGDDPVTDIDGDARPTEDDSPDYAGADIPN